MLRKTRFTWVVVLLALVLVLAAAAGCGGGSKSSSGSGGSAANGMSADQIVQQSAEKMKDVKSASISADMALGIQGDTTKMTDPTSKALLSQGVTLHADGKSQTDPMAADMTVSLGLAGQTIDLGLMAQGDKAWVQYQDQWYQVDKKNTKSVADAASSGLAPTEQLKKQGIDPAKWGVKYELVGTEDMDGTQVYHVKATVDTKAMVADLMQQMANPDLGGGAVDPATAAQVKQGLSQYKAQIDELGNSMKSAGADYWYEVDTLYLRKASWNAALDTTGQKDMQGIQGMTMKMDLAMSDFNQPVDVTPPPSALPFKQLMNQVLGGMMGGGMGGSTLPSNL